MSRVVGLLCGLLLVLAVLVAAARSSSSPLDAGEWLVKPRSAAARPPAPSPAGGRVVFRDDFEADTSGRNPPAGWELIDGGWVGVIWDGGHGSQVVGHGVGTSYGHVIVGSPSWSDYEVGVDVKVTPLATGFAGVLGRYQTDTDYYECVIHHASAVQLWRLRNGQGMELGGTSLPVDTTRFHRLELTMEAGHLVCALDGATVASADDATFSTGRAGLVASTGEAAEFDNVEIARP